MLAGGNNVLFKGTEHPNQKCPVTDKAKTEKKLEEAVQKMKKANKMKGSAKVKDFNCRSYMDYLFE